MKLYVGKIIIPDFECPLSYTVILSEDKSKAESETNKVRDILNSIPKLKTGNRLLLEYSVPKEMREMISASSESKLYDFKIQSEINEYEVDVNLMNNLINCSDTLSGIIEMVSKLSAKEAYTEVHKILKENEVTNN